MTQFPNASVARELPTSPWVVRGDLVDARQQADAVLSAARAGAARLSAEAADEADRVLEEARQEGLRDGAAAAAALIAKVSVDLEFYLKAREAELGTLAFAIAHRILGALPEEERLARAVRTALDEHRSASGLRLRTSPQMETVLRTVLEETEAGASVTIEVDDTALPGECTLIHPRGRIAVGPIDQLLALLSSTATTGGIR
jgi:flagellar biosynthesis/type III secretory pathway protein FliH